MKYTGAPLAVHGPSSGGGPIDSGGDYAIVDADGHVIGEAIHRVGRHNFRPAKANAKLWAKAPEMVAVLKELVGKADSWACSRRSLCAALKGARELLAEIE